MKENKPYNYAADFIRSLSIILVIIIHIFSEYVNTPKYFGNGDWWFANIIDSFCRVAVPLFVMLSGYFLLDEDKTYTPIEFFKKRFSKIGIPLLVWPILYYLWSLFLNNNHFVLRKFLNDYIYLNTYYHLYYLYLIAGLYILTPILKVVINNASKATKTYALIVSFTFAILVTWSAFFLHAGPNIGTIFTITFPYIAYFLAGDYLRNVLIEKKRLPLWSVLYLLAAGLTALLNFWYMRHIGWASSSNSNNANYDRYFYDYFSVTVVGLSLIAFPLLQSFAKESALLKNEFILKVIKQLTGAAFGMFLIHPFLMSVTNTYLLPQLPFTAAIPDSLFLVIKTFCIILASFLIITLVKRIPILKLLVR